MHSPLVISIPCFSLKLVSQLSVEIRQLYSLRQSQHSLTSGSTQEAKTAAKRAIESLYTSFPLGNRPTNAAPTQ